MKKKNKILLASFLTLSSCVPMILCQNTKEIVETSATAQIEELGNFITYERVLLQTKVVIPYAKKAFIEDCGYVVNIEWIDSPIIGPIDPYIPIGPLNLNEPVTPDSFHHQIPQYYYYADYYHPIIGESLTLNNTFYCFKQIIKQVSRDIDFLIENDVLGNYSIDFTNDIRAKNNYILHYFRSFRDDYLDNNWEMVAGQYNLDIKNDMDSYNYSFEHNLGKETINEYVRNFIGAYDVIDPIDNTQYIDIIHMFASIDGTVDLTHRAGILDDWNQDKFVRHLSSWGGDLQTTCSSLHQMQADSITIENVLQNFGSSDFNADAAAIAIGATFDANTDDIYEAIDNYFITTSSTTKIIKMFYGIADVSNISHENMSQTKNTIYDMLKLNPDGSDKVDLITIFTSKYSNLKYNSSNYPSVQIRARVGDLFYDYLSGSLYE